MPVSKKRKHLKKRTYPETITAPSGYVAVITYGGFNICREIIRTFHRDGRRYYHQGRKDREVGEKMISHEEFMSIPTVPLPDFLGTFDESVREAQYAQYCDGYEGRKFYDRVAFKRDDI